MGLKPADPRISQDYAARAKSPSINGPYDELAEKNQGIVITKVMGRNGDDMKIKEAYGKDDSDVTGTKGDERIPSALNKFDFNSLDHSIEGATAEMNGLSNDDDR